MASSISRTGLLMGIDEGLNKGLDAFLGERDRRDRNALRSDEMEQKRRMLARQLAQDEEDRGFKEAKLVGDGFEPLSEGGLLKPGQIAQKVGDKQYLYDPEKQQSKKLEIAKAMAGIKGDQKEKDAARLSEGTLLGLSEGNSLPTMLHDIQSTITSNQDYFDPVSGTAAGYNPYDTKAQTIQSQLQTGAQTFGKFMEGGKLAQSDEAKYRKMFPQLGDAPEVAKNKMLLVDRMFKQKQAENIRTLKGAGKNVSSVERPNMTPPELPAGLIGKGTIRVSNGRETYDIDPSNLADAQKDGFKQVK